MALIRRHRTRIMHLSSSAQRGMVRDESTRMPRRCVSSVSASASDPPEAAQSRSAMSPSTFGRASSSRSSGRRAAARPRCSTSSAGLSTASRAVTSKARRRGRSAGHRHGVPGRVDVSVANDPRERRVPARGRRRARRRSVSIARVISSSSSASTGFENHYPSELSGGMLQRRARPHAGLRAADTADGRAVRRARLANAAAGRRQGAADTAGALADDAADHARSDRSRAIVGSRRRHDLQARACQAHRRHRSAASATSEVVGSERFARLVGAIWNDLREEASLGMKEGRNHPRKSGLPSGDLGNKDSKRHT